MLNTYIENVSYGNRMESFDRQSGNWRGYKKGAVSKKEVDVQDKKQNEKIYEKTY